MPALRALVVVAVFVLAGAAPAPAEPLCSGIPDGRARLDCHERAARAQAPVPQADRPPLADDACTPASPCVGPKGDLYYVTPSGYRRHLSRK